MSEESVGRFSHIVCAAKTDVGLKRGNNEDAFGTFPAAGVFCVADGMGGGDDGEIASAAVVKAIGDVVAKCLPAGDGGYAGEDVVALLCDGLSGASDWICRRAVEKQLNGCGSTFVGVVFDATAPKKAMAVHAGDSRLYRMRGKKIVQITRDHSAAELLGEKDERKLNPVFRSMVMNAVGVKPKVEAELTPFDVAPGDRVLLCSDGLSRMVPDKKIASVSSAHADPGEAVDALIAAALEAGGVDNVTVVLLQVGELPPPAPVLELAKLAADDESTTSGSDEPTCPTMALPPIDPISVDDMERGGGSGRTQGTEDPKAVKTPEPFAREEGARVLRHSSERLVLVAVVLGTLAVLALVFSVMKGEKPAPAGRTTESEVVSAVKEVAPVVKEVAPAEGKVTPPPPVPVVTNAIAVPPEGCATNDSAKTTAAVKPKANVSAATNALPAAKPKGKSLPGAVAFAKACEGKALEEFVNALRRLSPQGRLLKEVAVFSKSGASLSVSASERMLVRAAVDLHWALKAVAAASPKWADGFPAGAASEGVRADWRTVQDSERLDDGTPDDAVFAASARLMANLPSLSMARISGGGDNR